MKGLNNKENLMSQYGGPDGELSASLRYQNQRYIIIFDFSEFFYLYF